MSYRTLKLLTILLPPLVIGGFEYIRHEFLLEQFSMEAGNLYITILTLVVSYLFSTWMFRTIERTNQRLSEEQSRRAVYEERERIARELHDNIAQILFFLNVNLKKGNLDEAKSAVSEIDNHLRQAIFNLRSLPSEGAAFKARLQKWLREWGEITGIEVTERLDLPDHYFTTGEEVQLFAIIQEAFTNIRKHSLAHRAQIDFSAIPGGGWELTIRDDGCGIADRGMQTNKYGLSMMRKRAHELGASFAIGQAEQGGTELRLSAERRKR